MLVLSCATSISLSRDSELIALDSVVGMVVSSSHEGSQQGCLTRLVGGFLLVVFLTTCFYYYIIVDFLSDIEAGAALRQGLGHSGVSQSSN